MKSRYDLNTVLNYGNSPIRVGLVNDEVAFCLSDLLNALYIASVNATYAVRKVPEDLVYKVSAVHSGNSVVIALNEYGAMIALCRLSRMDMSEVINLIKWTRTVKKEKLKGA